MTSGGPAPSATADWLEWLLHFICGSVAGAVICLGILGEVAMRPWIEARLAPLLFADLALLGGSAASLLGDRLWLDATHRTIPPDGIRHSRWSLVASCAAMAAGAGVLLYGLARVTAAEF